MRIQNRLHISVVVPCVNADFRLRCCLEGLSNQTFPREKFEIIVVLDGCASSDEVVAVSKRLGNLTFIKNDTCKGRSAARNAALNIALGDLAVCLDGDMVPCPTFLQRYAQKSIRHGADFVGIGRRFTVLDNEKMKADANGDFQAIRRQRVRRTWPLPYFKQAGILRSLATAKEPFWAFGTANCCFPRALGKEIGFFDEAMKGWGHEDQEFGYRLWKHFQLPFVYLPRALALHISHPRTVTLDRLSARLNKQYMLEKHGNVFKRWSETRTS